MMEKTHENYNGKQKSHQEQNILNRETRATQKSTHIHSGISQPAIQPKCRSKREIISNGMKTVTIVVMMKRNQKICRKRKVHETMIRLTKDWKM